jgi:hypothetical protein
MKMDDASLQELLRAAGRSQPPPPTMPSDLAQQVRGLHTRRRRTRTVLGGLVATAVLLGGTSWAVHYAVRPIRRANDSLADRAGPAVTGPDSAAEDAQRLRAEMAALATQAQRRAQIIEELTRRQRLLRQMAGLERQSRRSDPLEVARIEMEKTAFLLVEHARQQSLLPPGRSPADEYRRILEHFPGTNGARTAKENPNQIEFQKGDL